MLLLIGFIIGLVLGLTGAGGSVFAVPLLMLMGDMTIGEAAGVSLGSVAVSTIYVSLRNLKNRSILWMPVITLAITGAVTAPFGKWFGMQLPESWLLSSFSLLAMAIAVRMWIFAKRHPNDTKIVRAAVLDSPLNTEHLCRLSSSGRFELRPRCISGLVVGGVCTGLLSGLFGVGGGFLIVPLLLFLSQITMQQAVSSSLIIIAVISASGFASHLWLTHGEISWTFLGWVSSGGLIGMVAGQHLIRFIAGARLQQVFALTLAAMSLSTLYFHYYHAPL